MPYMIAVSLEMSDEPKNNSWQKYEIYLTFSKRLHLQSLIFISDTKRASNIGTWTDQVTSSSSRDGDIVRFSRREAEEFESEARTKVLLHT